MKKHRLLIWFRLLALAAAVVALVPKSALAQDEVPIRGSFTVSFTAPADETNLAASCLDSSLPVPVEAHGIGHTSLGAMFIEVQKTLALPGNMHGCVTMTSPNGDTLNATYTGTIDAPNANGFSLFRGQLKFTGGTGRFANAGGSASFKAVASFGNHTAFYAVEGTVSIADR